MFTRIEIDGVTETVVVHLTLLHEWVSVNVVRGNDILVVEHAKDGWHCFVHDACDPRRKLRDHPSRWRMQDGYRTCDNATELARFPLWLGKHPSHSFPPPSLLGTWFSKLRAVDLSKPEYGNSTYADILSDYMREPISDDEWMWLNQYNWGHE